MGETEQRHYVANLSGSPSPVTALGLRFFLSQRQRGVLFSHTHVPRHTEWASVQLLISLTGCPGSWFSGHLGTATCLFQTEHSQKAGVECGPATPHGIADRWPKRWMPWNSFPLSFRIYKPLFITKGREATGRLVIHIH